MCVAAWIRFTYNHFQREEQEDLLIRLVYLNPRKYFTIIPSQQLVL